MTYIPKHVFRGGDELPPDVPSPSPQEWDAFMANLDEETYMTTYRRWKARYQDDDQDDDQDGEDYQDDEYDPEDHLDYSIQ